MSASSGEITAPCGVPTVAGVTSPSSITPTFSHLRIKRTMRRSPIRCSTKRISHSWLTVSKKLRMSASSIQSTRVRVIPTASASVSLRPVGHHAGCVPAGTRTRTRGSLPRRSRSAPRPPHAGRSCPPVPRCPTAAAVHPASGYIGAATAARGSSPVDAPVQVLEFLLKPLPVLHPRHSIHSGGRLALQPEVGLSQQIDVDVVEQRGEPLLLVQPGGCPYTLQPGGHACPARCPARVGLARVPLGPCLRAPPSADGRPPAFARFAATAPAPAQAGGKARLLVTVYHRLRLHAFPMRTRQHLPVVGHEISRFPRKEPPHMPGSQTARGRQASRDHATRRVAFRCLDRVGTPEQTFAAQWLAYAIPPAFAGAGSVQRFATPSR